MVIVVKSYCNLLIEFYPHIYSPSRKVNSELHFSILMLNPPQGGNGLDKLTNLTKISLINHHLLFRYLPTYTLKKKSQDKN